MSCRSWRAHRQDLEQFEWVAFKALLPEVDSMMVGHANYPSLDDSGFPSSLSQKIVHGILREEWQYTGTIISDDLDMGAIVGHYGLAESVTRAVGAGNDLVLLCHRPELIPDAAKALEKISPARAAEAEEQIGQFRHKLDPPLPFSVEAHAALDRKIYQLRVDTLGEAAAAARSVDDGKRSPVETF